VYTGGGASPHRDPVGFGGQFGYFTEWETKPNTTADAGSSLLLLTHRYYDPATGRFVNRDPIGYSGGINLYSYAGGNPVNRMDPDGTDDFALLSALPPSPSRKVSWLEHWHQKIVNALSSPGWQIGMIQGQIEQQNQFDQMVAMRQMQEEERDANTASAVGFVNINNPANNAFYVIGMLKDTLRYRNKAGFVVAPDLGADWNLMKNREWVAEGARGGKRFLLVTPISEINEAIEKGTGGLYTRFELTLLRNKYPSTPVLKGYKSKIAGEKVKGKF
jgi:RHS repeat-associated protein